MIIRQAVKRHGRRGGADHDGAGAAEALQRDMPDCQVLMLTGLAQPHHLLRALQLSVRGFLAKDAPAGDLIGAIRLVAAGQLVLDPAMVAALETGASPLTARQTDVLRTAATGISTAEIAAVLLLSPATVRNYLSAAIAKLGRPQPARRPAHRPARGLDLMPPLPDGMGVVGRRAEDQRVAVGDGFGGQLGVRGAVPAEPAWALTGEAPRHQTSGRRARPSPTTVVTALPAVARADRGARVQTRPASATATAMACAG